MYKKKTKCRLLFLAIAGAISGVGLQPARAENHELPTIHGADVQPLLLQVKNLRDAMDYLGHPFDNATTKLLDEAASEEDDAKALSLAQQALDPLCLFGVVIRGESLGNVTIGPAKPMLIENGWSQYLVKVHNETGVTSTLNVNSPNAGKLAGATTERIGDLWLDVSMVNGRPLAATLSGVELEYRIVQIYSRDFGQRTGAFSFDVAQGAKKTGERDAVTVTFDCHKAVPVTLRVLDENIKPTTAGFVIKDKQGRVYPSQAKRLAPDFAFQPQIYRHDGENVELPPGEYVVNVTRGPEYLAQTIELTVADKPTSLKVQLKRWVDPAAFGWWSGDHHIHAAGCSHYNNPSQGVHAPDMFRHCLGEDLKVGCNLTWGPCFDYQKQFFTGVVDKVSKYPYLLRYDVEVSGFGSHQSGHLCLLRLNKQIPPGGDSKHHWPKLCLNTYRWAKKQGAVCGPAHSGWGLSVPGSDLPNYTIPPFDGIGACEYIADVTHTVEGPDGKQVPAVDFMSMVDTPYPWELNIWYHTLNCGFRTRISGETDFPCIYGDRVGIGRSYAKLEGRLDHDRWCEAVRDGAAYVSDGMSHLINFKVDAKSLGSGSELRLDGPKTIKASAKVAALLPEQPAPEIGKKPVDVKPYWHLERARLSGAELEYTQNDITHATQQLAAKVAVDLRGNQADVEAELLSKDETPKFTLWQYLGPIRTTDSRTGHATAHGPEVPWDNPRPLGKLKWEPRDWQDAQVIDLKLPDNSVCYLYREVTAKYPASVELDVGADDAIRVWLDGKEVIAEWIDGEAKPGQGVAVVQLSEGKHHLLMKITNGVFASAYYFKATHLGIPDDVRTILTKPIADRTDDEQQRFFAFYGMHSPNYHQQAARVERLRTQPSRKVNVELVVDGYPVASQIIEADGSMRDVTLETKIERSSWVAMRILPSSHTNPVFVLVEGKPIRASSRSANWCLKSVEQCRTQKERFMGEDEKDDFHEAYDHAIGVYRKILKESVAK